MSIGEKLTKLRNENRLKQTEVAESLGISPRTLSHWENNRNEPGIEMIRKICEFYKISISELFGENVQFECKKKNVLLTDIIDMLISNGKFINDSFESLDDGSQDMLKGAIKQYVLEKKEAK